MSCQLPKSLKTFSSSARLAPDLPSPRLSTARSLRRAAVSDQSPWQGRRRFWLRRIAGLLLLITAAGGPSAKAYEYFLPKQQRRMEIAGVAWATTGPGDFLITSADTESNTTGTEVTTAVRMLVHYTAGYLTTVDELNSNDADPAPPAGSESGALGLSGDGGVLVGYNNAGFFTPFHAIRWTEDAGIVDLGTLAPGNEKSSYAYDVSSDAAVITGYSSTAGVKSTSFAGRWRPAWLISTPSIRRAINRRGTPSAAMGT